MKYLISGSWTKSPNVFFITLLATTKIKNIFGLLNLFWGKGVLEHGCSKTIKGLEMALVNFPI